ncbi:hypothetical protein [Oceanithermus sp.]
MKLIRVFRRSTLRRWGSAFALLCLGAALALQGVAVAPPRFEIVATPGSQTDKELAVFARETGPQRIVPAVYSWTLDPGGRLVLQKPDATNYAYDASKWITASFDPFTLQPDEPVTVKFSVSVPPDGTLQGSYRAALAFTTEPKPGEYKGFAVMVNTRAVVVVYVTIQGTEQPAAELQGITVVTGEEDGKRFLVADVVNKGNVYLRLNGELRFVNTKGEVIKRTPLPERVLLREGLVRYELPIPPDLPEDTVLAAIEIQPQGPAGGYGGPPLYGEVGIR